MKLQFFYIYIVLQWLFMYNGYPCISNNGFTMYGLRLCAVDSLRICRTLHELQLYVLTLFGCVFF